MREKCPRLGSLSKGLGSWRPRALPLVIEALGSPRIMKALGSPGHRGLGSCVMKTKKHEDIFNIKFYKLIFYYADTKEGFTSQEVWPRNQTDDIILGIGSALYKDGSIRFTPSRYGDYIFYFKVEEMELMRTVEIK